MGWLIDELVDLTLVGPVLQSVACAVNVDVLLLHKLLMSL